MADGLNPYERELIRGKTYRVEMQDCCIVGELTGVFLSYVMDPDEPDEDDCFDLKFDFGTLDTWMAISFHEIEARPAFSPDASPWFEDGLSFAILPPSDTGAELEHVYYIESYRTLVAARVDGVWLTRPYGAKEN